MIMMVDDDQPIMNRGNDDDDDQSYHDGAHYHHHQHRPKYQHHRHQLRCCRCCCDLLTAAAAAGTGCSQLLDHVFTRVRVHNEAREARSARLFSWVSKEKKPLHIGPHTRVKCLELLSLLPYEYLFSGG